MATCSASFLVSLKAISAVWRVSRQVLSRTSAAWLTRFAAWRTRAVSLPPLNRFQFSVISALVLRR